MNLAPLEVDLMPAQAVLLAHTHPGVNRKQQMGKELRKACPDGRAQSRLSVRGEKSDAAPAFGLAPDSGGGVAIDPFVVDADPEDQREG